MKPYETIEEWKSDMDIFKNNPEDTRFLASVANRLNQSSVSIQEEVKEIVEDDMFEQDPLRYMDMVSRRSPDTVVIINTLDDPWFEV